MDVIWDAAADEDFLLDLLNSTPIVDGVAQDELHTAQAGREFLRGHGIASSAGEWRRVRAARALLQEVVRGRRPPASLAGLLAGASAVPSLTDAGLQWRLAAPRDHEAAARAVLAWAAVQRNRPGRLRACENPECALFLLDRSKPNNARWCSMATCGNRMKARRHYERSRAAR